MSNPYVSDNVSQAVINEVGKSVQAICQAIHGSAVTEIRTRVAHGQVVSDSTKAAIEQQVAKAILTKLCEATKAACIGLRHQLEAKQLFETAKPVPAVKQARRKPKTARKR